MIQTPIDYQSCTSRARTYSDPRLRGPYTIGISYEDGECEPRVDDQLLCLIAVDIDGDGGCVNYGCPCLSIVLTIAYHHLSRVASR